MIECCGSNYAITKVYVLHDTTCKYSLFFLALNYMHGTPRGALEPFVMGEFDPVGLYLSVLLKELQYDGT